MKYWLMKTEPSEFSIQDLAKAKKKTTHWDGVRNYQARNFMRDDMRIGDRVLLYHSNADPSAVVGTAKIVKESYPDHTAWDPKDKHFDPKSSADNPRWFMVDIQLDDIFLEPISLALLALLECVGPAEPTAPAVGHQQILSRGPTCRGIFWELQQILSRASF